ncbi:MAG: hypothetical protein APR63_00855 [Desulfuromonas sp. SDB]|nr:MAG: hypothetical protein APR63_00855 [Desulfuromonas sp. SDB]
MKIFDQKNYFKQYTTVFILVIIVLSVIATLSGILSKSGPGEFKYQSIRGQTVNIYGKGIYQHMSVEVAVQGIAQDYITLILGIPLLVLSWLVFLKKSLVGKFLLSGILGYFLITYLFYMCMGMYNQLFLIYVTLTALCFWGFALSLGSMDFQTLGSIKLSPKIKNFCGGFLIFNSVIIGLLWIRVIIPPLLNGTIYPQALEHYTTLIVQGLDLSLLLPLGFIAGLLLIKETTWGIILAPIYLIFLSVLMAALNAKIFAMNMVGLGAGPALIIIPLLNLVAIISAFILLKNIRRAVKL